MDLYQAIHTRRTIHNYLAEAIDPAALDRILAAAHMAPCHKLTWPWRFNVVGPETRQEIAEIGIQLKGGDHPPPRLVDAIRAKVLNPGGLVVVSQVLDKDEFRRREDYAATCCAIQNLQLAARAEGYGSKWSTGKLTQAPALYELLGLDSTVEEIVGFVWVGVSESTPEIHRPDPGEVIRHHN